MKTTRIEVVLLLNEYVLDTDDVAIPATLAALRARERVVLVQDASCAFVVTLERGVALMLWDQARCWGDQRVAPFAGTLAQAVRLARTWLAKHLRVRASTIHTVIAVGDFPDRPLRALPRRKSTR